MDTQLVGCAVRGPKHEADDSPCQDAWCYHELPDDRFVIAVADGLGSATLSHVGSEVATTAVAQQLREHYNSVDSIDSGSTRKTFKRAFRHARTSVAEAATRHGVELSELHTTLLAVVAGPSGIAGAGVGDGGAICGQAGTYEPLFEPEAAVTDLAASHITYPLTHPDWRRYFRCDHRSEYDRVAVFSDGLEQWAWEGPDEPNAEWLDSAFRLLEDAGETDAAEQELRAALNNDNYRGSGDDKTLVMGRGPSEPAESPTEESSASDPSSPDTLPLAVRVLDVVRDRRWLPRGSTASQRRPPRRWDPKNRES